MFGMESMIKEMLGVDPSEIKVMGEKAALQAQQLVEQVIHNQNVTLEAMKQIHHKQVRIEKMLESIMRERGIEIPNEEESNGSRVGPH